MRITVELRRPARRSVALVLGGLLLLTPAMALASHQFTDVPANHPFHTEIGAIAKAGITAGFPDGGYHPGDAVTRQAMAAFMHRGFGRAGFAIYAAPMTPEIAVGQGVYSSNNVFVPVRSLTITVPGDPNSNLAPQQLVHLHGIVSLQGKMDSSTQGCPCQFTARVRDVTGNTWSWPATDTFVTYSSVSAGFGFSFDIDALFQAPSGSRTYYLELALGYRDTAASSTTFPLSQLSSLSAQTFPFGPTGSNTP